MNDDDQIGQNLAIDPTLRMEQIDEFVRREHDVDVVLNVLGVFVSAFGASSEVLARALEMRVGTDAWGRSISGFPLAASQEHLTRLLYAGIRFAIVQPLTPGVGRNAIRSVTYVSSRDGEQFPELTVQYPRSGRPTAGRESIETHAYSNEDSLAGSDLSDIVDDPGELESLYDLVLDAGDLGESIRAAISPLAGPELLLMGPDGRRATAQKIRDARVEFLVAVWESFLRSGDVAILETLRIERSLAELASRIHRIRWGRGSVPPKDSQALRQIILHHAKGRLRGEISAYFGLTGTIVGEVLGRAGFSPELWRRWSPEDITMRDALIGRGLSIVDCSSALRRSPWDITASLVEASSTDPFDE